MRIAAIVLLTLMVATSSLGHAAGQNPPAAEQPFAPLPDAPPPAAAKVLPELRASLLALARFVDRQASGVDCVAARSLPLDPAFDSDIRRTPPATPRASSRTMPAPPACQSEASR
jgi:hypothetical protein